MSSQLEKNQFPTSYLVTLMQWKLRCSPIFPDNEVFGRLEKGTLGV